MAASVTLTFIADRRDVPDDVRLRLLLKVALRSFGYRCIQVDQATTAVELPAMADPLDVAQSATTTRATTTTARAVEPIAATVARVLERPIVACD